MVMVLFCPTKISNNVVPSDAIKPLDNSLIFWMKIVISQNKNYFLGRGGGGRVVSILAFCSKGLSLNPASYSIIIMYAVLQKDKNI